jgi:sporulation protein YlmC with PRC-barrel domain
VYKLGGENDKVEIVPPAGVVVGKVKDFIFEVKTCKPTNVVVIKARDFLIERGYKL